MNATADPDARWGTPRVGDWIQTHTGRKFFALDPRPEDVDITDIAHALSNQCRFSGHLREFYSVAEHSVRVYRLLRQWMSPDAIDWRLLLCGLLHDASEAYLIDLPRPIKRTPQFAFYGEIEDKIMSVIASTFGFDWPMPAEVKRADGILLGTEARDLMLVTPVDGWHKAYELLEDPIVGAMSPRQAKWEYLAAYLEIVQHAGAAA